jgi:transposase
MEWQPADTPEALKAAYQAEREPQRRTRLHGLWLLRSGWTLERVAEAVGVHYRSVQRGAAWYRAGGLAEIRGHPMGGKGNPSLLTAEQQAAVAEEVATGRFGTAAEIRDWIVERFGVTYQIGGVYSLLKRLRCGPQVPRPVHAKADREQPAAWKKGVSGRRLPRQGEAGKDRLASPTKCGSGYGAWSDGSGDVEG